jgi:hypothetical protein
VTKTQGNKNAEIVICDMAIQSQPLNQAWIWTVDVTPYRSFGDRDLGRQRTQCIKNVDFAICEITIQLAFQLLRQLSSFCLRNWEVEPSCSCV